MPRTTSGGSSDDRRTPKSPAKGRTRAADKALPAGEGDKGAPHAPPGNSNKFGAGKDRNAPYAPPGG